VGGFFPREITVDESERTELIRFYHEAFASAIGSGAFEDIEEIWTELATLEPDNTENFLMMVSEMEGLRRNILAGTLLLSLVRLYRETANHAGRASALKEAARLLPMQEELKEEMAAHYREVHADHPLVEQAIRKSGLMRPRSIEETAPKLETFLKFREGDIVNHPNGWGMGRVTEIDLDQEALTVDFETRKNHTVSLEMAAKILETFAPGTFMALKFDDPDKLRKQAEADGVGLIKLLLTDLGGKGDLKKIKAIITDGVIEPSAWTKWWNSAKKAALKDPYLSVPKGASAVIELRNEPVSHQDEILEKIAAARTVEDKITLIEEYAASLKAAERTPDSLGPVARTMLEAAKGLEDASAIVQIALIIDDLKSLCTGLDVDPPKLEDLFTPRSAIKVVEGMGKTTYKRRALLRLKQLHPEKWADIYAKTFFLGSSDLWDFAAKELLDAGKHRQLTQAFEQILAKSNEIIEVYLWLCRAALMDKYPAVLGEHSKIDLVERLFTLVNDLSRGEMGESKAAAAARKKLLAKARDTISVSDFKHIRQIIEDSSEDEARRIYHAANVYQGLTENTVDNIMAMVIAEHPGVAPPPAEIDAQDDVIYTTLEGLRRKEVEFGRVINEEIPENQKALGAAISFGDLSENAEYAAAREQQTILMSKAERIKDELARAKLIDTDSVNGDTVSIGTGIEIRNTAKKRSERYTILGPWDSDAENGIISYLAPLAAAFLGKSVGEKAVLDFSESKPEYEIISITKAI